MSIKEEKTTDEYQQELQKAEKELELLKIKLLDEQAARKTVELKVQSLVQRLNSFEESFYQNQKTNKSIKLKSDLFGALGGVAFLTGRQYLKTILSDKLWKEDPFHWK